MLPVKSAIKRRLLFALTLAISLCLMSASIASAQSLEEYFQLAYDPVSFDKSEIQGSEVFNATITGRATCTKNLPVPVSEVNIISQVVAEHAASGTRVTLNSGYTVAINPFPDKKDDTAKINQAVPLQFPAQAESGNYNVIGEIVEAKVKVVFGWIDATEYLPREQQMGKVKYTAPEPAPVPEPVSAPPTPTEPVPAPTPTPAPEPAPSPIPIEYIVPRWVWLIVAAAIATTALNIFWFMRHRTK